MLDRRTIPYVHWQTRLGRAMPRFGEIVHGIDDLEQAIMTIALTEKGSVPTEPEKCVELRPYLDRRPAYAIPYITRELFDAITLWEPRVVVEEVRVTAEDFDHFHFPVFWRPRGDVAREIIRTVIQLPEYRRPGVLDAA